MKLISTTTTSMKILFLALALNACAGDDASMEDPIEENGEENAANVESNENGWEENGNVENAENLGNGNEANLENEGGNNFGNEGGNNFGNNLMNNSGNGTMGAEAPANEFVNNAAGENFLDAAAEAPAADPTADAALAENSSDDLGIAPSDDTLGGNQNAVQPNTNVGATDASLGVPDDSAPGNAVPAAVAPAPMTGGRVHYVMKGGASAYDRPSGQVVKSLEQGDHPLVTAEGEWARTSDGAYIQNSSLTSRPVSRAKSPKAWR